jgi:hypothetical protein
MDEGDSEVDRRAPSCINDIDSRHCGAMESRRRIHVVLCSYEGGTVWRRGDIDGKSGERLCFVLTPWRRFADKDVEVTSGACAQGTFFRFHRETAAGEAQGLVQSSCSTILVVL